METVLPIVLLVIAFGLLVIEVFVPSLGLITIGSVVCFIGSLYLGFAELMTLGWSLLGISVVGVPVVLLVSFKLFPSTPLGKHMMLFAPKRHPAPATRSDRTDLVGEEGVARSALRPSGIAIFGDERVDVVTRGEMVDAGRRVKIIENLGNRFVVREIPDEAGPTEEKELR